MFHFPVLGTVTGSSFNLQTYREDIWLEGWDDSPFSCRHWYVLVLVRMV